MPSDTHTEAQTHSNGAAYTLKKNYSLTSTRTIRDNLSACVERQRQHDLILIFISSHSTIHTNQVYFMLIFLSHTISVLEIIMTL